MNDGAYSDSNLGPVGTRSVGLTADDDEDDMKQNVQSFAGNMMRGVGSVNGGGVESVVSFAHSEAFNPMAQRGYRHRQASVPRDNWQRNEYKARQRRMRNHNSRS